MMQQMRNPKVYKSGLFILLALTIPAFVLMYGAPQTGGSGGAMPNQGTQVILTVNTPNGTRGITIDEFNRARNSLINDYALLYTQLTGQQPPRSFQGQIESQLSRREIADHAAALAMVEEYGRNFNLSVTLPQVRMLLMAQGVTDEDLASYLRATGMTEQQFVAMQRELLRLQRSEQLVSIGARVSILELWLQHRLQNDELDMEYAVVEASLFEDDIEVSDAEVEEYFAANTSQFIKPEERIYRYIRVTPPAATQIEITDEEVQERYAGIDPEENPAFLQEGGARIRQIMITDETPGTPEERRTLAEELRERILAGESMDSLANEYTNDTNVRMDDALGVPSLLGGMTTRVVNQSNKSYFDSYYGQGWFDLASGLEVGEVSPVFEVDGQWFVARAEERIERGKRPLADVRPILESQIRNDKRQAAARERRNAVDENELAMREAVQLNTRLEGVANDVGADIRVTSPTLSSSAFIAGVGNLSEFQQLVRRLRPGRMSDVLRLSGSDDLVVLEVAEVIDERPQTLDEVRDRVEAIVRTSKAAERANEVAGQIAERVRSGESFTSATLALGIEGITVGESQEPFRRSSPPSALAQAAASITSKSFRASEGDVFIADIGSGDSLRGYAVCLVRSINQPDQTTFFNELGATEVNLRSLKAAAFVEGFQQMHLQNANPRYNEDFIPLDSDGRG